MKPLNTLLLATALIAGCKHATRPQLFPIVDNNKVGFIDTAGGMIIKPVFRTAGEFFDGLAAASMSGTYGYINETGNFVIQPQFDFAMPFSEGLAIVYKDGHPYFINKQGQKAFECNFHMVEPFENGRAKVQTAHETFGFIDKQGKLIIDTAFIKINPFIQGMAVVYSMNNPEVGVIDTLGHFIIPYGKYKQIEDFENGYFKVELPPQPGDSLKGQLIQTGFIDKTGKLVLAKVHNNNWIDGNVYCGLVKMSLYKHWIQEEKGSYSTKNSYEGFINLKGDIVINDTTYKRAYDFSNNRAFIRNNNNECFIINTQGKRISNEIFSDVVGKGFNKGYAFVAKDGLIGMIDTNAHYLIKPQFSGVDYWDLHDGYFFYYEERSDENGYQRHYGMAKTDGNIVLKPVMESMDMRGFRNGLLKCMIEHKKTYINNRGKIVWQDSVNNSEQLANLNIDYMNRAYFYAHSKPNEKDAGGFGGSENYPRKITITDKFPANTLSIVVHPELKDTINGRYHGITVFVANTAKNKVEFNAQDSRLYMKVQAKNVRGEWTDIEYFPGSWCGNSYHTLTLDPNYYWKFITPIYEGDIKTKFRIALTCIDSTDKLNDNRNKKEITFYSNEYEGSVNPGQFWRKPDYRPTDIMDPYND